MRCILSIVTPLQLTLLIRKRKRYTIWISEMRRIAYKKMQKRSSSVDTMVLPRSMRPLKIFKKLKKNNGMLYFSRHSHGEWDSPVWAVTGPVDFAWSSSPSQASSQLRLAKRMPRALRAQKQPEEASSSTCPFATVESLLVAKMSPSIA